MRDQGTTIPDSEVMEYRHVRHKVGKREMAVTVCYQREEKGGVAIPDLVVHGIALAFCCPKDQFSKAMGRRISSGRLSNAESLLTGSHSGIISDEDFKKKTRFIRLQMAHSETPVTIESMMRVWLPEIKGPPWWVHTLRPLIMERLTGE